MFWVSNLVLDVFVLVLCILINFIPKLLIYKNPQITTIFVQECHKFVLEKKNQTFIIQFTLVLLLAKADIVLEKQYDKRNIIRFFYSGGSKIVFALLNKPYGYYSYKSRENMP